MSWSIRQGTGFSYLVVARNGSGFSYIKKTKLPTKGHLMLTSAAQRILNLTTQRENLAREI
ncbi:hypothetical protein, partial [Roseovarius sp. SYSU LYC5161]|uniref:hypothetical protein n=1 Tax=Roseovarius halophilus (ex Wu et al. 2025) TaxID=3376060 RepID=UPI00399A22A1